MGEVVAGGVGEGEVVAGDTPLSDPRLDYLGADLRDWPPTLVQVGGTECIAAEAELLGTALRAAGVRSEIQIWPGQIHAFPALGAKTLPEAKAAIAYGREFLRATTQDMSMDLD